MIIIRESSEPDVEWNKRLISSELGTIYQTIERAKIIKNKGIEPVFLKFLDSESNIMGQLLANIHYPFNNAGTIKSILKHLPNIKEKLFRWSYGPIIFDAKYIDEVYLSLENFLKTKKYKVSGWQHPLQTNSLNQLNYKFKVKMWSTFLIDLSQDIEKIYKNIAKHNGRKNIERSMKRGVIIEEINENNLEEFYDLRKRNVEALGAKMESFEKVLEEWKILREIGHGGLLAKKNDKVLSGMLFSFVNGFIIERNVARSDLDHTENFYSQDLIRWKIIEWGNQKKFRYYNLAGFNPQPISKKEEAIYQYKKKWGGTRYDYYNIFN